MNKFFLRPEYFAELRYHAITLTVCMSISTEQARALLPMANQIIWRRKQFCYTVRVSWFIVQINLNRILYYHTALPYNFMLMFTSPLFIIWRHSQHYAGALLVNFQCSQMRMQLAVNYCCTVRFFISSYIHRLFCAPTQNI